MELLKYDYHNRTFSVCRKNKIEKFTFGANPIEIEPSSISCGIHQVFNINTLASRVNAFVARHHLTPLKKEIFKKVLTGDIKYDKFLDDYDGAMWLVSTNLTGNEDKNLIETALNELCSIKTKSRLNPNSTNKIRMWVIPNTKL